MPARGNIRIQGRIKPYYELLVKTYGLGGCGSGGACLQIVEGLIPDSRTNNWKGKNKRPTSGQANRAGNPKCLLCFKFFYQDHRAIGSGFKPDGFDLLYVFRIIVHSLRGFH
jgi:hypothetical protein